MSTVKITISPNHRETREIRKNGTEAVAVESLVQGKDVRIMSVIQFLETMITPEYLGDEKVRNMFGKRLDECKEKLQYIDILLG